MFIKISAPDHLVTIGINIEKVLVILSKEIKTAGAPAKINLTADRKMIKADGQDLSFVTVEVLDADNNPVPNADNLIKFSVSGEGTIAGVDNGDPTSMESFKAPERKLFNGKALVIVRSTEKSGNIHISATADGIKSDSVTVSSK